MAGILAHTDTLVRMISRHRRIDEVAGRVTVAFAADELQQFIVSVTPVETKGLVEARGRTTGRARCTATGVVDQPPGPEALIALVAAQHPPPVDQDAHALLKNVGVEPIVAGSRLVPDLASGAFLWRQSGSAGMETRVIVGDWHPVGGGMTKQQGQQNCCKDTGDTAGDHFDPPLWRSDAVWQPSSGSLRSLHDQQKNNACSLRTSVYARFAWPAQLRCLVDVVLVAGLGNIKPTGMQSTDVAMCYIRNTLWRNRTGLVEPSQGMQPNGAAPLA